MSIILAEGYHNQNLRNMYKNIIISMNTLKNTLLKFNIYLQIKSSESGNKILITCHGKECLY